MRRGQVITLVAVSSAVLSVLLAVAVNVATGGTLPEPWDKASWLAWPAVAVLAAVTVGLAIWQQRLAGAGRAPDELRRVPAELPAPPTRFAGRAAELATVDRLLAQGHRTLALVGPPGAGKTGLALHIAHARRTRFPDGQLFAALRGASAAPVQPEAVLTRFLGALGVPDDERRGSIDDLAARYRSALARRKMIIVLDDARDRHQVAPLLPGNQHCLVLVTSRRQLTDLPGAGLLTLGRLTDAEAHAVLARAVGDDRVDADPQGAARMVALCGGLPLALRIAGARLRARPTWTPSHLADLLADEQRRLDELHAGDSAVRSAFETAYLGLSTFDRLVFRRVGSHPGQVFGVGSAAALAGYDEETVAAALERLVDAHLVETPAPGRYRLHDLLRLFATERLAAEETPAERTAYLARLLDWLTTHASSGQWLAQERDNVLAAANRAVSVGEYERVWSLASAVDPLVDRAGDHPDRLALWQAGAAAARALGDDQRLARALRLVCESYRQAGEVRQALDPAQEAVAVARRLSDRREYAAALFTYGEALRDLNRLAEASDALRHALRLYSELGDAYGEVGARAALGTLHIMAWQPELAVPVLEPALALLTEPETTRHAWVLRELCTAYRLLGRRAEAVALNHRTVETARRVGDDLSLGYALLERGWLAHDGGSPAAALRDVRQALAIFERIRHGTGIGAAYEAIGEITEIAGRYGEAIAAYDAAIVEFDRLGDTVRSGTSRLHRAAALAAAGRLAEARTEWLAAEQALGDTASPEADRLRERLRQATATTSPT